MRQLARRVVAAIERGRPTSLLWQNRSGIAEPQSERLRKAFAEELERGGVAVSADASEAGIKVVIGGTPTQLRFAVKIGTPGGEKIFLGDVSRASYSAEATTAVAPQLQKELLWQQREPILDAIEHTASGGRPGFFLVLTREALFLYQKEKGQWTLKDSAQFSPGETRSRDMRGEIRLSAEQEDRVQVALAKKVCDVKLAEKLPMTCHAENEHWRDGVFLAPPCSAERWLLQAGRGDWSVPDRLQLRAPLEPGREPAGEIELPGPVLSLASGESFRSDTAVVFNLAAGNYEVYRISVDCRN